MTGTALTEAGPQAAALAKQYDAWSPDQIALIRSTLLGGKGTMDELSLLLHQAQRTGLDPLAKQIYGIFRSCKLPNGQWGDKMTIQVGIDGFRAIAEQTGELDGSKVEWCGKDGVWRDIWTGDGYPFASKVTVYRKNCKEFFTGVARWDEYVQTGKGGTVSAMWQKMSTTMIAKCAEALALRKAFPHKLSGLYSDDEMSQAGPVLNPVNAAHGDGEQVSDGTDSTATDVPPDPASRPATVTKTPALDPAKINAGVERKSKTVELPGADAVSIKVIAKKTKAVCAISGKPLGVKGDRFAYAQVNGTHWMAREDEYNALFAQSVKDGESVDGEFEDVPEESAEESAERRVREVTKGTPAGRLVDELVGPEAGEAPVAGDLSSDLPN